MHARRRAEMRPSWRASGARALVGGLFFHACPCLRRCANYKHSRNSPGPLNSPKRSVLGDRGHHGHAQPGALRWPGQSGDILLRPGGEHNTCSRRMEAWSVQCPPWLEMQNSAIWEVSWPWAGSACPGQPQQRCDELRARGEFPHWQRSRAHRPCAPRCLASLLACRSTRRCSRRMMTCCARPSCRSSGTTTHRFGSRRPRRLVQGAAAALQDQQDSVHACMRV